MHRRRNGGKVQAQREIAIFPSKGRFYSRPFAQFRDHREARPMALQGGTEGGGGVIYIMSLGSFGIAWYSTVL